MIKVLVENASRTSTISRICREVKEANHTLEFVFLACLPTYYYHVIYCTRT